MFAAYSEDRKNADDRTRYQEQQSDLQVRTRWAVQQASKKETERIAQKTLQNQEKMVIQQIGFGESDDEDGGPRIELPEEHQKHSDEVFLAPEVRRQANMKKAMENNFSSFPSSSKTTVDVVELDSSSDERNRRRRKKRDRSDSRTRSRHRGSEKKKKKMKKHRRRYSDSSSSDSDRSRDRRHSRRDRSPSPKKLKYAKVDYKFLTDADYAARNNIAAQILVTHRQCDYDNWSLGQPKKEIAKCRLEMRSIDGLMYDKSFFNLCYGAECPKDNHGKRFHELLAEIAKIVPRETYFRPVAIQDGFWKVSKRMDLLNMPSLGEETEEEKKQRKENDMFTQEYERLHKATRENVYDVESFIKLVQMEGEKYHMISGSFVNTDFKSMVERKMSILEKAMDHNRSNVKIRLMNIECMMELNMSPDAILDKFRSLAHRFPSDPMVWIRYLDYIQFNSNVFGYAILENTFHQALVRIAGLAEGINVGQAHMITDLPQFYLFQLYVYIRYLKWQIGCGHLPVAISNIQATFELNFGMDDSVKTMRPSERKEALEKFWETRVPRIGDLNALGAKMSMKFIENQSSEEIDDMERAEHEIMCYQTMQAIESCLRVERDTAISFVEFERKMLDIDARPKRTDLEKNQTFVTDFGGEFEGVAEWKPIDANNLTPYWNPNPTSSDCVQPLLETLGISFLHSTGCFSLSEHVINSWKYHADLLLENRYHFDEVPTYSENTMLETGKRILQFMINQRIQKCKDKPDVLDDELVKYMMAVLMTEANEMEKELKFHHLRLKRFEVLLEEKLEKVFPEMLKTFPKTLPIIRSVASEKFISWWERGISDQEDIEKRVVLSVELELAITPTDKQKMMEIQRKMFKFLDKCAPRTVLKSKSCADLQLPLFVEILRCRLSAQNERALRAYLAITILGVDPQSVETIEKEANYAESVRDAIKELVKMVKRKQREEMPSFIPELPRTEALIESLQMITEFAFLTLSPNMRGIVNGMVTSVLERCQRYETRLKEFTIGQEEKERDRWDVQFILDTLLRHLSKSEMQTAYIENFKKIITRAADLFPCETKYMRKFTEVHSGSTLKNMQLGIILTNRNKKIMESRLERFDLELERKQMMNSLSTMFSSMRLSASIGKSSNQRSVYNKYLEEARNLHDPAVWRLAIKAAARVGTSCLEKDAYIRAIGQCPWSLNIHLDYIEGMGPSSQDGQQTVLGKTMCYLLEIGDSMPHITFVEEEETLDTYLEVAMKAPRVE